MRLIGVLIASLVALCGACTCAQTADERGAAAALGSVEMSPGPAAQPPSATAGEAPEPAPELGSGNPVEGRRIFATSCAHCHTVGAGRLLAPDLRGVTLRRDRDWLIRFLRDPGRIGHTDPTGGEVMPPPNLDGQQIRDVLEFLAQPGETTVTGVARDLCHTAGGCWVISHHGPGHA